MIGFAERERARERRLSISNYRTAIFFLWVILLCSLLSLFLSIHNDRSTSRSRISPYSIRPHPRPTRRASERRSFISRALFHRAPSSSPSTDQAQLLGTKTRVNGDSESIYEDSKRVVHTGPNPLHN